MTSIIHLPVNISPDSCPTVFNQTLAHTLSRCSPALPKHFVLPKLCLLNAFTPSVLMIHSQVILFNHPLSTSILKVDALLHNSFSCISFQVTMNPFRDPVSIMPDSFCQIHFNKFISANSSQGKLSKEQCPEKVRGEEIIQSTLEECWE